MNEAEQIVRKLQLEARERTFVFFSAVNHILPKDMSENARFMNRSLSQIGF